MTIGIKHYQNMRKNSRNKGSRFERTIAKAWETWTGYKFSRTPGSGGWAKAKDWVSAKELDRDATSPMIIRTGYATVMRPYKRNDSMQGGRLRKLAACFF